MRVVLGSESDDDLQKDPSAATTTAEEELKEDDDTQNFARISTATVKDKNNVTSLEALSADALSAQQDRSNQTAVPTANDDGETDKSLNNNLRSPNAPQKQSLIDPQEKRVKESTLRPSRTDAEIQSDTNDTPQKPTTKAAVKGVHL